MTRTTPQVTVVIVTYQSRGTIRQTLQALFDAYEAGVAAVTVVDNASTDGTVDFVTNEFPWVQTIINSENVGFGRGCNRGVENAETPFVFFLNPDAVIDQDALGALIEVMEQQPRAGVVAPAIIESGRSYQSAGMMTTLGTVLRASTGYSNPYPDARPIVPGEAPFETIWVCGAAMLMRTEMFRQVGGFDPRFFLYFEETDLCRRLARQGAGIWATGTAVIHHVGGHSARATDEAIESSCVSEHYYRSRFYYLIKHFGWFRAVTAEVIVFALERLRFFKQRLTRHSTTTPAERTTRPFLRLPYRPRD